MADSGPTAHPHSPDDPPRHWRHDLVELAALFTAVTVTDAAAKTIVGGAPGPWLLVCAAVALLVTAFAHGWWSRRRSRTRARTAAGVPQESAVAAAVPAGAATRLWRLRVTVREECGALAQVCTALAGRRVDVVALQTMPVGHGVLPFATEDGAAAGTASAGSAVDELLVRAPTALKPEELTDTVRAAGGLDIRLVRADAHDLVDGPTRALRLAACVARDPAELPTALRRLLGDCEIRWLPVGDGLAGEAGADQFDTHRLRLADPSGGVLIIERTQALFTPAEFARARALAAVDTPSRRKEPQQAATLEAEIAQAVTVRRAGPEDIAAARALHRRCSPQTLVSRYHGARDVDAYLPHLLSPRLGRTLAAETPAGRIVGLGHLLWDGNESEIALLVEDSWQRRGIGGALLRRLVRLADQDGSPSVYAVTQASNTAIVSALRSLGRPLHHQMQDGTLVLTVTPARSATPSVPRPSHGEG